MPLTKDLREFVGLLNTNEVEYLVVGAFALAFHGIARYTGDLDLFVHSTPENAARLVRVISQFGFGGLDISEADFQKPHHTIQLGVEPNRIDLLTGIDGVTFKEAWQSRSEDRLDGIPTSFIGIEALLRNKESTGRARDRGDAEELRKRIAMRAKP